MFIKDKFRLLLFFVFVFKCNAFFLKSTMKDNGSAVRKSERKKRKEIVLLLSMTLFPNKTQKMMRRTKMWMRMSWIM